MLTQYTVSKAFTDVHHFSKDNLDDDPGLEPAHPKCDEVEEASEVVKHAVSITHISSRNIAEKTSDNLMRSKVHQWGTFDFSFVLVVHVNKSYVWLPCRVKIFFNFLPRCSRAHFSSVRCEELRQARFMFFQQIRMRKHDREIFVTQCIWPVIFTAWGC